MSTKYYIVKLRQSEGPRTRNDKVQRAVTISRMFLVLDCVSLCETATDLVP